MTVDRIFETLKKYFISSKTLKKCLILDADGVLWKGISGEEQILIDKNVLAFQKSLIELYEKGVLLCICSKNEDFLIEGSFNHPDMLLKKEHFVSIIANRLDKVTNIRTLVKDLNISFDSVVFTDDSDYELGLVSVNLPEIDCIKFDYSDTSAIERIMGKFSDIQATSDVNRTQMYIEQKAREKEKNRFASVEDYNASLMTKIDIFEATDECLARLAEISSRTHQFNLSSSVYTEDQLREMLMANVYKIYAVSVKDKYGDMGIVGMAVIKENIIESFMLSCRVFDRGFEQALLNYIKEQTIGQLKGVYVPTDKNRRYADFYAENGVVII